MGSNGTATTDDFGARLQAALGEVDGDNQAVRPQTATQPDQPQRSGRGPVGAGEHVVRQGECISSIAKGSGHFWETIWDDSQNTELREARKDPYVLLPHDRVHVPELRRKAETGQSERRHRFRRKGQPEMLRIRVLCDGEPRGNQPYELIVDGESDTGVTDADGKVTAMIKPDAKRAELIVGEKGDRERHVFTLGELDPIDEMSGIQGRLDNLGFRCGLADGVLGPRTERALASYQHTRKLHVTGQPDEATRRRLREDYGC